MLLEWSQHDFDNYPQSTTTYKFSVSQRCITLTLKNYISIW